MWFGLEDLPQTMLAQISSHWMLRRKECLQLADLPTSSDGVPTELQVSDEVMEWIALLIATGLTGYSVGLDVGIVIGIGVWMAWIVWKDYRNARG